MKLVTVGGLVPEGPAEEGTLGRGPAAGSSSVHVLRLPARPLHEDRGHI